MFNICYIKFKLFNNPRKTNLKKLDRLPPSPCHWNSSYSGVIAIVINIIKIIRIFCVFGRRTPTGWTNDNTQLRASIPKMLNNNILSKSLTAHTRIVSSKTQKHLLYVPNLFVKRHVSNIFFYYLLMNNYAQKRTCARNYHTRVIIFFYRKIFMYTVLFFFVFFYTNSIIIYFDECNGRGGIRWE